MIGRLSRQTLEAVVLVFAALGFFLVPLGKYTAFEHARRVLATPAADEAGRELARTFANLRDRVLQPNARDDLPSPPPAKGRPRHSRQGTPEPVPPELARSAPADAGVDASLSCKNGC